MAELGIITMLAKSPKKASFTAEQMIRIYEESGRKADTAALREAALKLYPDILQEGVPPISCLPGSGRSFRVGDSYISPTHTLVTHRALMVGILPDGTALEY